MTLANPFVGKVHEFYPNAFPVFNSRLKLWYVFNKEYDEDGVPIGIGKTASKAWKNALENIEE